MEYFYKFKSDRYGTGYKAFKSKYAKQLNLFENSFGIEPEITIKLAKKALNF